MGDLKQKGSLAFLGQKKKQVQKLKTILSQPYPRYLPKIQLDDHNMIKELISNDKQNYKQSNYKKNHGINTGLNSIIRLLKINKISCLLLSSGIKPFSILYQIITLALTNGQPPPHILYVPNLNEMLKEIFHTDSFALGCIRGKFTILEEYMKIKCLEFPLPENFLIYHGLKQNQQNEQQSIKIPKIKSDSRVDFDELYVMKSHAYSSRSFYPKNAINFKPLKFEEPQEFSGNYISFAGTDVKKELINDTIDHKTDKQNLINCMKKHLHNPPINLNITKSSIEAFSHKNGCKKRKKETTVKLIGNINKKSVIQYAPLKIKKIQGNPKKVKFGKKNIT